MPQPGTPLDQLDTPALCIDYDKMESNIQRMVAICRQRGVDWRPHSKAHKSPRIARWEIESGAIGVTCAKLGEAEVLAAGGVRDILIANLIVGPEKVRRLVELCRVADPIIVFDHLDQARPISAALAQAGLSCRAILEVDIGLNRVGVVPGVPTVTLAKAVSALPGIRFVGLMGYEGHLLTLEDLAEKEQQIRAAMALLVQAKRDVEGAGIACPIVSAGGTGSYDVTSQCPGITELQAGGLIFMDAFYRTKCHVSEFDYSLTVITTVVGRPAPNRAIIDAGRKSHFADSADPIFLELKDVKLKRLSAEHGELTLGPGAQHLRIGDRIEFVPGYSDFTNVLHDEFYVHRDRRLIEVWPLEGRGKIR